MRNITKSRGQVQVMASGVATEELEIKKNKRENDSEISPDRPVKYE